MRVCAPSGGNGSLSGTESLQGAVARVAEVVVTGKTAVDEGAARHKPIADVALDTIHAVSLIIDPGLELVSNAAGRGYAAGGSSSFGKFLADCHHADQLVRVLQVARR